MAALADGLEVLVFGADGNLGNSRVDRVQDLGFKSGFREVSDFSGFNNPVEARDSQLKLQLLDQLPFGFYAAADST